MRWTFRLHFKIEMQEKITRIHKLSTLNSNVLRGIEFDSRVRSGKSQQRRIFNTIFYSSDQTLKPIPFSKSIFRFLFQNKLLHFNKNAKLKRRNKCKHGCKVTLVIENIKKMLFDLFYFEEKIIIYYFESTENVSFLIHIDMCIYE